MCTSAVFGILGDRRIDPEAARGNCIVLPRRQRLLVEAEAGSLVEILPGLVRRDVVQRDAGDRRAWRRCARCRTRAAPRRDGSLTSRCSRAEVPRQAGRGVGVEAHGDAAGCDRRQAPPRHRSGACRRSRSPRRTRDRAASPRTTAPTMPTITAASTPTSERLRVTIATRRASWRPRHAAADLMRQLHDA